MAPCTVEHNENVFFPRKQDETPVADWLGFIVVKVVGSHSELLNLQTITRVPPVISNAAAIAAFPKDGFVTAQTTAATTRTRPTAPAQVGGAAAPILRSPPLLAFCFIPLCEVETKCLNGSIRHRSPQKKHQ